MIDQLEIANFLKTATRLASESSSVAGSRRREEYQLADTRILELTWDESTNEPIVIQFKIFLSRSKNGNWRVSRFPRNY